MVPQADGDAGRVAARLLVFAATLGLASGLAEGLIHVWLQRLGILENSWHDIVWIAAIVNGLLLLVVAALLVAALAVVPRARAARRAALFVVVCAATLPVLALLLKEWLHTYAIVSLTLGASAVVTRRLVRGSDGGPPRAGRSLAAISALTLVVMVALAGGARLREQRLTAALPEAPASAPHVLLIVADTLRADHVSSYGYRRATTPNIDRLAAEGVLFEQAFSTSSYTLPSHASLLTGLSPREHGVGWQSSRTQARASYPTLAETLQARGYRTGAFSANTFWFTREHGFGRGFIRFDDFFYSVPDMVLRTAYGRIVTRLFLGRFGWNDIPARRRAPDVNAAALRWVDAGEGERPFLAVINYMDAHDPYLPPEPYRSRFATRPGPGGRINWLVRTPDRLAPEELQAEIDAYDGAIAYLDEQVAALVSALDARPDERDLLVVITADHGEEFFEHGGFLHANHLYREVIHVPLVVWEPGAVPAGRRVTQPVSIASVPATILARVDAGDATYAHPLQPLWSTLDAPAAWPAPRAYLGHRPWANARSAARTGALTSAVGDGLHFIDHSLNGPELYDLRRDPLEQINLARQADWSPTVAAFRSLLAGGRPAELAGRRAR